MSSSPGWPARYKPTAAQWNAAFADKADADDLAAGLAAVNASLAAISNLAPAPSGGDDWPALQPLLVSGAPLQLRAGTYRVSQPLVAPGGGLGYAQSWLRGSGAMTILSPLAAMTALLTTANGNFKVSDLVFQNVSSRAGAGFLIDKPNNNLPIDVDDCQFIQLPKGVRVKRGDNIAIIRNLFNTNTTAISLECDGGYILNVDVSGNYILGGNGISAPVPIAAGTHVEGLHVSNNSILPAVSGAFAVNVQAGLELYFTNNVFDQILDSDGVIINGTAFGEEIVGVKFVENWIGPAGGAASGHGMRIAMCRNVDVLGGSIVKAPQYGAHVSNSSHVSFHCVKMLPSPNLNGTGDFYLNNVADAQLIGNVSTHPTNSVTEAGSTVTVALGSYLTAAPVHNAASRYFGNFSPVTESIDATSIGVVTRAPVVSADALDVLNASTLRGAVTALGNVIVGASKLTVNATSGNIVGAGSLALTGVADITGAATLRAGLTTIGNVNVTTGLVQMGGTQVLTSRQTGWTAPTGTLSRATFDQSTVTLAQLAQRVAALITDLQTHGLVGT